MIPPECVMPIKCKDGKEHEYVFYSYSREGRLIMCKKCGGIIQNDTIEIDPIYSKLVQIKEPECKKEK
jgi:hypothetical protein